MSEWKKYPEETPETFQEVLIYRKLQWSTDYDILVDYIDGFGAWFDTGPTDLVVTHWMELPAPPEDA